MNKPDLNDVEKAILKSASRSGDENPLSYLKDEMNHLGYNFTDTRDGEKKAYKEAEKLWWDLREQKQSLSEIPVNELDDLPSTRVEKNGKKYYIHGIVHGIIGTSDSVKNFVRERAMDYASRDDSRLFLEANLKRRFDLHNGVEFKDMEIFDGGDALKLLGRLAIVPFAYAALSIPIPSRGRVVLKTLNKAKKDIRFLPQAKEVMVRSFLPEPLYMDYISDNDLEKKFNTKRSELMAYKMKHSTHGRIKEVHAIVGLSHEDQIRYFLTES